MSMVQTQKLSDKVVARSVLRLAMTKLLSEKDAKAERDNVPDGSEHSLSLTVLGTVDGEDFREDYSGKVTVGFGSTRAGKVDEGELIAWILSHVPAEARAAILVEAVEVFTKNDFSFPCEKGIYDKVKESLSTMRSANQTTVRGSVSVKIDKPHLSVVG